MIQNTFFTNVRSKFAWLFLVASISQVFTPIAYAAAAPTITSVTPVSGVMGDSFTITGTNFVAGQSVFVNGLNAGSVTIASATTIAATLPASSAGFVDIVVSDNAGQSARLIGAIALTDASHLVNKWTGTTNTDWNTTTNWSLGRSPTNTDLVSIDGGTNQPTYTLTSPITLQAINIGQTTSSTLTLSGNNEANPLSLAGPSSVGKFGTLTHSANTTTPVNKLNIITANNFSVDTSGKISADMKGYQSGHPSGTTTSKGASYGGYGSFGKEPYGSIKQPFDLGANSYSNYNGGGAIKLTINGTFTNNGNVTANTSNSYGAAGSVWIDVNGTMAGNGNIQADSLAGSGGRVALYADSMSYTGTKTAKPINSSYLNAAGTVYTNIADQINGDLTIEGGGFDISNFCTLPMDGNTQSGTVTYDNLKVTQGAKLCVPATMTVNVGNLVAANGPGVSNRGTILIDGTLNVPNNTTLKNYYIYKNGSYSDVNPVLDGSTVELGTVNSTTPWDLTTLTLNNTSTVTTYTPTGTPNNTVYIKTSGNLTVGSGSSINADNKGWPMKSGPGYSTNSSAAAYGGYGYYNNSTNTNVYGSIRQPTDFGSGGTTGNNGGGAVKLEIGETLTNNGNISANSVGSASWGSAGSVLVTTKTLSGTNAAATISASNTWAYGSGGRVAIYANAINYVGKKQAYSQNPYRAGAGTVFTKLASQPNGDLLIDNNGGDVSSTGITPEISSSPVTYDSITVTNGARYGIANSTTVNTGGVGAAAGPSVGARGVISLDGVLNVPNNTSLRNYYVYHNGTYSDQNPVIDTGTTFELLKVTATNPWTLNSLMINNGGTITTYTPTSTPNNTISIKTSGNLTIQNGGSINADNKGWPLKQGPGYSATQNVAAYGGYGFYNNVINPKVYGSVRQPTDYGSGGVSGSNGGGAIRLDVGDTLTNNGSVTADTTGSGAWGTGGSIWATAGTIAGTNTGATFSTNNTWAYGSGGRMAFYANTSTYVGKKQASAQPVYGAGAGTIYNKLSSQSNGDLVIDSNTSNPGTTGHTPEITPSPVTYDNIKVTNGGSYLIENGVTVNTGGIVAANGSGNTTRGNILLNGTLNVPNSTILKNYYLVYNGSYSDKNPIIDSGTSVELTNVTSSAPWSLTSLTINNGGTVTTFTPTSATPNNPIYITTTGDLTVNNGGSINGDGKGYPAQKGPGASITGSGAYGGYGQHGSTTNPNVYGSVRQPFDYGSGGRSGENAGGLIRLSVGGYTY